MPWRPSGPDVEVEEKPAIGTEKDRPILPAVVRHGRQWPPDIFQY